MSSLADLINARLAAAEALADHQLAARSGIFQVALRCPDPELLRDYARAFPPPHPSTESALRITLVTARHIDLSDLLPTPRERGRLHFGAEHCLIWAPYGRPILYLLDRRRQRGLVWLAADSAPAWELSRPACPLLNAAALDSPWTVAHGAAVGRDGRFLLLAGPGRSGKTTAALACARAGWDYAGDDYVFADSASGTVLPLYASARLRHDMAPAFADLLAVATRAVTREDGETRHELELTHPTTSRLAGGPVAALLLPRRAGARQGKR